MMKRLLLLLLVLPNLLFAKSFIISAIPLPKTYVLDLNIITCNELCLQQEWKNEQIFSFLAHASGVLQNKQLNSDKLIAESLLNIGSRISNGKIKIALLLPYTIIGRYAASTTTSTLAYLLARNRTFDLKSFNIQNENQDTIADALNKISAAKYNYIIAPLTKKGVNSVIAINPKVDIFFPTINKNDTNTTSPYLYFGGIDYKAQLALLLQRAVSPLVIFHTNSPLSNYLTSDAQNSFILSGDTNNVIKYKITDRSSNMRYTLQNNNAIAHGSFLMNTPIVKTGMVMSQLTLYDVNSTNILSTQINYNPLILSLTQYQDRKNMLIANSIIVNNEIITQTNALLNNNIRYNWINYATTIGVDYFFHLITNSNREYPLPIKNNQVIYPINLVKPSYSRFIYISPIISKPAVLPSIF